MTKIVFNACYGGFNLSHEGMMRYAEIKGITLYTREKYGFTSYFLCPLEEYERIHAEESVKAIAQDRFARSNAMYLSNSDFERNDPVLVQVVEELGDKANGLCAALLIAEVPTGMMYRIDEYDGNESVMTQDMYNWKVA